MSEDHADKAIRVIRDGLAGLVEQLDAILKERVPETVGVTEQITDKTGKTLARIVRSGGKTTIFPIETLRIRAEDPAIKNFLVPSVLDKMRKQGVEYNIESKGELLTKIVVKGIKEAELKRFRGAMRWTLEKASERPWNP